VWTIATARGQEAGVPDQRGKEMACVFPQGGENKDTVKIHQLWGGGLYEAKKLVGGGKGAGCTVIRQRTRGVNLF